MTILSFKIQNGQQEFKFPTISFTKIWLRSYVVQNSSLTNRSACLYINIKKYSNKRHIIDDSMYEYLGKMLTQDSSLISDIFPNTIIPDFEDNKSNMISSLYFTIFDDIGQILTFTTNDFIILELEFE